MSKSATLSPLERRTAWSLSLIYLCRMLGLFIILPVFALVATDYAHSTPFTIGLAIGIYGLMQAALQVPMGMLSDRIGRKRVITLGLVLLALGSFVAALADSIEWVIIGRALQGSGAMAAAVMALAADLTRPDQRSKVMAVLGMSIGLSFVVALILGPLIIGWYSIDMVFWVTGACALLGIAVLHLVVPNPERSGFNVETGADPATMRRLLRHPQLLRLDASIFLLHLIITASFVVVPLSLRASGLEIGSHWKIYLVAMVLSIGAMVPLIVLAEKRAMRGVLLGCVGGLAAVQLVFGFSEGQLMWLFVGITAFFSFLNALEALLPSLVSRYAPEATRGSAMGLYSSSQFIGAFVGGAGGGWLFGALGPQSLYFVMAGLCAFWAVLLLGIRKPEPRAKAPALNTEPEPAAARP